MSVRSRNSAPLAVRAHSAESLPVGSEKLPLQEGFAHRGLEDRFILPTDADQIDLQGYVW